MNQRGNEWLFKEDEYNPVGDKDTFIDKSILTLINILSKARRNEGYKHGVVYRLNHLNKFVFTILTILFLSLGKNTFYVLAIDAYLLLLLSLMDIRDIKRTLAASSIVVVFSVVMLSPSFFAGNRSNTFMLLMKIWGSLVCINFYSYTTRWRQITKCLRLFFVPDIFILILDITLKYIFILGEFSLGLLYALKLKSVGKNEKKHVSLSGLIGTLFLKSKDMSEEMYSAMVCRGFTGEYTAYNNFKFNRTDYIYSLTGILLVFLYFVIS